MRKILLFILIFPSVCNAEYFEPFSNQDVFLQSVFTIMTFVDWSQTKQFEENKIIEMNPVLEKYPSQIEIDSLIGLGVVSHLFVSYLLPSKYRQYWQVSFIKSELRAVNANYSLLIKF